MEMVLNNGFFEMSQDEVLDLDGGFDIGSAVTGFVCAIYSKWNDIWYSFGQNIYYMTHSK